MANHRICSNLDAATLADMGGRIRAVSDNQDVTDLLAAGEMRDD